MQIVDAIFYVLNAIILVIMAVFDWRTTYIPEPLCYVGFATAGLTCVVCTQCVPVLILMAIILFAFALLPEFKLFGDADYVPLAIYIGFFARDNFFRDLHAVPSLIAMIMLLFTLYPTAYFYYKEKGVRYYLFQGMYVPILPAIAVAWCLTPLPLIISGFWRLS